MSDDTAYPRWARRVNLDAPNGCWEWTGPVDHGGYGKFSVGHTYRGAHRWSWEYYRGPIPAGKVIDHLCRNRRCVNPEHLEPVTQRENLRRGRIDRGHPDFDTHCPKGHPHTPANTRVTVTKRDGITKYCAVCANERNRERRTVGGKRRAAQGLLQRKSAQAA